MIDRKRGLQIQDPSLLKVHLSHEQAWSQQVVRFLRTQNARVTCLYLHAWRPSVTRTCLCKLILVCFRSLARMCWLLHLFRMMLPLESKSSRSLARQAVISRSLCSQICGTPGLAFPKRRKQATLLQGPRSFRCRQRPQHTRHCDCNVQDSVTCRTLHEHSL